MYKIKIDIPAKHCYTTKHEAKVLRDGYLVSTFLFSTNTEKIQCWSHEAVDTQTLYLFLFQDYRRYMVMSYVSVDVMWTLLGAAMVFFMQAGFSLCEAGLTRAKNTGNILMKNLMDFCIGTPAFWLVGFGIMFGGSGAVIGGFDPFILGDYEFGSIPKWCYVIFQTVFCATAATIVSGSMAERTKFSSYCVYSALISLVVYPVSGHWIWGGGWLSDRKSVV